MKKKIAAILLFSALCVSVFAGCQSNSNGTESGNSTASGTSTVSTDTSAQQTEAVTGTISVVTREKGSGTRDAFIELTGILKKDDSGSTDRTSEDATTLSNTEGVLSNISGDLRGIGYISLGSLNDKVKAVSIDGVAPSVDTIIDGTYKISRPFNIAVKKDGISDAAQDFINYILSADGQKVIADNGYVQIDSGAKAYVKSEAKGKVTIEGSSSVSPAMVKLKEAYAAVNPDISVEIQTTDSSSGMNATMEGRCDIGMASRGLKDTELEQLTETTIAKDGIVVVVNNANNLSNLTMDQVCKIFIGEITNWEDLA
ncbi:MAG: substrate-binding domain-containing protein [Acutalibacteraceae bacterium]